MIKYFRNGINWSKFDLANRIHVSIIISEMPNYMTIQRVVFAENAMENQLRYIEDNTIITDNYDEYLISIGDGPKKFQEITEEEFKQKFNYLLSNCE